MYSAVLILPISLKSVGDQIGEAMGWGPVSYSIPLTSGGDTTHIGLRADVHTSFIELIEAAKKGVYPEALPEALLRPVIEALIADFSQELWGESHLEMVCAAHELVRLK